MAMCRRQRGDSGTSSAAVLNQPVVNGDKVSTGPGGRAEVQLDFANILRLGSNAQVNLATFTKKYIQVQVGQGLVNYSVFGESETEPEIDTPNVAFASSAPGWRVIALKCDRMATASSLCARASAACYSARHCQH